MALLSVCIPTYNGAAYLRQAISSVLAQTLTDFELIIVDDHSTDDSVAIARSFDDSRLRVYQNDSRLGLVGNWNRCLELTQGKYICLFHQDDVMLPDNLARKVMLLEQHPAVGLVYSDVYLIDDHSNVFGDHWFCPIEPNQDFIETGSWYFRQLLLSSHNFIACPSVIVRRACYTQVGLFDSEFPLTVDLEMWLRVLMFYDIGYLAEPLVKYRWHGTNESHNFSETEEWTQIYEAKVAVLNKFPGHYSDESALRPTFELHARRDAFIRALWNFWHSNYRQGKWYLRFAFANQPSFLAGVFRGSRIVASGVYSLLQSKSNANQQPAPSRVIDAPTSTSKSLHYDQPESA